MNADPHSLNTPSRRSTTRSHSWPITSSVGAQIPGFDVEPSISSDKFSTGSPSTVDDVEIDLLEDRTAPTDDGVISRSSRGFLRTKRTPPKSKQSRASSSRLTPAQRANVPILPTRDVEEAAENEPRERSDSDHGVGTTDTLPPTIEYPEDMGVDLVGFDDDVS